MDAENEKEQYAWETYFRKQAEKEVRIHRDYLGWIIYSHKKRYKPSDRDKLIKQYKRRFQAWNCEERNNELILNDPDYPEFSIIIKFGNFVTQKQHEFSVKIESQSFDYKRRQMNDHAKVCQRMLGMLPKGKKEGYRITKQGIVPISIKNVKYSLDALLEEG
jgi:hypothetical protein